MKPNSSLPPPYQEKYELEKTQIEKGSGSPWTSTHSLKGDTTDPITRVNPRKITPLMTIFIGSVITLKKEKKKKSKATIRHIPLFVFLFYWDFVDHFTNNCVLVHDPSLG